MSGNAPKARSGRILYKIASFTGGLAISCVIVGVVLSRSPDLREELESQGRQLLKTTKSRVAKYQTVIGRLQALAGALAETAPEQGEEQLPSPAIAAYNAQWEDALKQ
jgi:hypothetical protein